MAWLGDKEFWVGLIGYASIVSAALFGLLALFTDYKKEGRVTRWGRLYAGGIALSAVLALTSSVLQKQISADAQAAGQRAAGEERARQKGQFDTQLEQFRGLNRQMGRVNDANNRLIASMTETLRGQATLLGHTQRGLLLTAGLGVQERQNTGRVLRGLWDESTRVRNGAVVARVTAICDPVRPGHGLPRLIPDDATAQLRVAPLAAAQALRPFNMFADSPRLPATLQFVSMNPRVMVRRLRQGEFEASGEAAVFESFYTDGSAIERPEQWEGVAVELLISADPANIVAELSEAMGQPAGGREALAGWFEIPANIRDNPSYLIAVLPCGLEMELWVNGRRVAQSTGLLVHVREGGSGVEYLLAKFPIVETARNVFPRFAGQ
jgi:hypothetical protein